MFRFGLFQKKLDHLNSLKEFLIDIIGHLVNYKAGNSTILVKS